MSNLADGGSQLTLCLIAHLNSSSLLENKILHFVLKVIYKLVLSFFAVYLCRILKRRAHTHDSKNRLVDINDSSSAGEIG